MFALRVTNRIDPPANELLERNLGSALTEMLSAHLFLCILLQSLVCREQKPIRLARIKDGGGGGIGFIQKCFPGIHCMSGSERGVPDWQ